MAIIREYVADNGIRVRISDDCYWPEDEREERIRKANREILRIVAEAMQNEQLRDYHD